MEFSFFKTVSGDHDHELVVDALVDSRDGRVIDITSVRLLRERKSSGPGVEHKEREILGTIPSVLFDELVDVTPQEFMDARSDLRATARGEI